MGELTALPRAPSWPGGVPPPVTSPGRRGNHLCWSLHSILPTFATDNCIRDCIADLCRRAHLSPLLEQGCGIGPAKDRSRPADILIPNWSLSRSAAFDIKVIHPLDNSLISDAGQTSGASAAVGEQEKLENNALGCLERGWICHMCHSRSGGIWRLGNHCKRNILKNC